MSEKSDLESLYPAIRDLSRLFEAIPNRCALIGGVAFGLRAFPRATKDVDAIIHDELGDVEALAKKVEARSRARKKAARKPAAPLAA